MIPLFFPKAKTALKGKRFQDTEEKRDGRTERYSLGDLCRLFSGNILNDGTNVFKWVRITFNIKEFFIYVYFFISFSHQSGNVIATPLCPFHPHISLEGRLIT
jgi:hypothetical protein